MINCDFCEIVNNKRLDLAQGVILYEDELLTIFPARGAPVSGYLMIIVNRHCNSFAELSCEELKHVDEVINNIKILYKKHFNIDSILLEHGSTKNGRHPKSIVHAHLHLIPFNFNNNIENELMQNLKLKSISKHHDIIKSAGKDYWFYCNPSGKCHLSVNVLDAPRSIFMNLIAKQIGMDLPYEWRIEKTNELFIDEMKEVFKDFRAKTKHKEV